MKKPLLDVLFASDKRKNVLLLLQDGPKEMGTLLKSLRTTRQALLPQLKILEDNYLIIRKDDTCELTTIGEILVDEIAPLIETLSFFESDLEYWGSRSLDFMPTDLFNRIHELGPYSVITPSLPEMYDVNREFHEATKKSKSLLVVTTVFHPGFHSLYSELVFSGVEVSIIVSGDLLEKMKTTDMNNLRSLIKRDRMHLYLCRKSIPLMYYTQNDDYSLLSLFKENGEVDNRLLLCSGPSALSWGKELFDYYFMDSASVDEV